MTRPGDPRAVQPPASTEDLIRHLQAVDRLQVQRLALLTAASSDPALAADLLDRAGSRSAPTARPSTRRHRAWAKARNLLRAARSMNRHHPCPTEATDAATPPTSDAATATATHDTGSTR